MDETKAQAVVLTINTNTQRNAPLAPCLLLLNLEKGAVMQNLSSGDAQALIALLLFFLLPGQDFPNTYALAPGLITRLMRTSCCSFLPVSREAPPAASL